MIIHQNNFDYNKNCRFEFGRHVQAHDELSSADHSRYVISANIPNAFVQTCIDKKLTEEESLLRSKKH